MNKKFIQKIGNIILFFSMIFCLAGIIGVSIVFADAKTSEGTAGQGEDKDKPPVKFSVDSSTDTIKSPEGSKSRIPPLVGQDKNYLKGGKAAESGGVAATSAMTVLVPKLIKTLLMFAAAMALIFIIYSGWQYVTAMGDENAYGQAKKGILWAIIGLVLTIISYALVDIIAAVSWT